MSARIFLVDDQALVRAGFRMLIEAQPDMEVVGEAGDGRAALEALAVTRADLVLMDVRMPHLDGVQATERLTRPPADARRRRSSCSPRSTSTSTCSPPSAPARAASCSRTPAPRSCWAPSARCSAATPSSRPARPAACSTTSPARCRPRAGEDPRLELLTPREREVLLEVARGRSNAEIAAELFMAEATVKTHVGRLLAKLDQRDRVQLVVFAYETGLVRPGR